MSVIADTIGNFGKYQLLLYIMIFFICLPLKLHLLAALFLSPPVTYECETNLRNYSSFIVHGPCPCENPRFDKTVFEKTITTEWKLICSHAWMNHASHFIFQIGAFFGNILFGIIADRWGRKLSLTSAVILLPFAGMIPVFLHNFWAFTVFRCLSGFFVGGIAVTAYVLLMEFVGISMYNMATALFFLSFTIAHLLLPLIGFLTRNFKFFQFVISSFSLLSLFYIYFLPESPRWLLLCNKIDEATECLETVAKINNMETANIRHKVEVYMNHHQQYLMPRGNLSTLFRTKHIRKNIFAISYNSFASSFCKYGVSVYVSLLSGDIFANVAFSAALPLLATIIVFPFLKYFKRKPALFFYHILSGVSILCSAFISKTEGKVFFCSLCILNSTISFIHEFQFATELFPTVVRSIAIGFTAMVAKVGIMLSPLVASFAEYTDFSPTILVAVVMLTAAVSVFALTETKNGPLLMTVEEAEQFCSGLPINTRIDEDS